MIIVVNWMQSVVCKARQLAGTIELQVAPQTFLNQLRFGHSHLILIDKMNEFFRFALVFGVRITHKNRLRCILFQSSNFLPKSIKGHMIKHY